jgi:RHS repeat-associated protein
MSHAWNSVTGKFASLYSLQLGRLRSLALNCGRSLLLALSLLLGAGSCLAADAKTTTYYYTDSLGSVLATADAAGVLTSTVNYRPYGKTFASTKVSDVGFAGHVQDDDVGLVYMQARYYDADTARFISIDPTSGSAGNYFKFNRYIYVSGNPYYSMDPDGRDDECSLACRKLRDFSDYTSGIGQGLNDSRNGRGGPLGDMSAGDKVVTAAVYQNAADGADALSPYADPIVGMIPGGDATACAVDSCGPVGWVIAVIGAIPGEGVAKSGVMAAGGRLEFNQARNAALRWLEARGFKASVPVWNRFPTEVRNTRIVGYATDATSARVGYRIEFDARSGAHINTFAPDAKGHFLFDGTEKSVNTITNGFNR